MLVPWVYPTYNLGTIVESNAEDAFYIARNNHLVNLDSEPTTGTAFTRFWSINPEELFSPQNAAIIDTSPGTHFQLAPRRAEHDFQLTLLAIQANDGLTTRSIAVQGTWSLNTFGTWHGTFQIQRSLDNGNSWETLNSYESAADRNIATTGTQDLAALFRLKFLATSDTATTSKARAVFTPESASITGHALIDTYVSPGIVTGIAQTPLLSGQTFNWSEGAFSPRRGFPQAIGFHDARLILAGTSTDPTTLWFSKTDAYTNFTYGTDPSDALSITLATNIKNRIRWILSQNRLFIGTEESEWIIGQDSQDGIIKPGNLLARQYTTYGSAIHQPTRIADSFVFLSRNRQRIREIAYEDERQAYDAP
jgi:hypothetical protein